VESSEFKDSDPATAKLMLESATTAAEKVSMLLATMLTVVIAVSGELLVVEVRI
jgi:hypothetical protein